MKWLALVLLVLLAGCSTASPRAMRRQADTLDQQADALRQDAAELERQQYAAMVQATEQQAAYLTSIAPTWTPQPSATPQPTATPEPTATSTPIPSSTATAEIVAHAQPAATDSAKVKPGPVESSGDGSAVLAVAGIVLIGLAVWAGWPWIRKYLKWR